MKYSLVIFIFLFCFQLNSQENNSHKYNPPQFIGGKKAFQDYLNKYMSLPPSLREAGMAHDFNASICISKVGKVKFVNVTGADKDLKDQLKRILTLMPDWREASRNGTALDTCITKTIYVSLGNNKIKKGDTSSVQVTFSQRLATDQEIENIRNERDPASAANELYEKAKVEVESKHYAEAIKLFNEAKEKGRKTNSLFHFNIGIAYFKSGDKDSGCTHFMEAARQGDIDAYNFYLKNCK